MRNFFKRTFSLLFLGTGVFLLIQVILPFISYKIWEISVYQQNIALISPSPNGSPVLGVSVETRDNFPALVSTNRRNNSSPYSDFSLTISSIKLNDIPVKVDSNNFEESLAHLPGSALPGEKGNIFITGHSSLPQLFSSTNFKAIFSNLPQVKKEDKIVLKAGGQTFTYRVIGLKIVDPKETWVINPPDETGRYLSLMTCVPPGLYLKRLIVLAELE